MIGLIFRAISHAGRAAHKTAPHAAKVVHKATPHVAKATHKATPHVARAVHKVAQPSIHYARVPAWKQNGKIYFRHVRAWLYGK